MILTLNAGSSSLKFGVFDLDQSDQPVLEGLVERVGENGLTHERAISDVLQKLAGLDLLNRLRAVGHRVVHGGEDFRKPTLITAEVEAAIERLASLAPLHNPANLAGIRASSAALRAATGRELPQVAVFDTAFHSSLPEKAFRYPVPQAWYEEFGVRKYGFHGTSHAYVSAQARRVLALTKYPSDRMVTLHLGNGCSAAAVSKGVCVETSMGLTPLAGMMMGTRPGDLDPGLDGYLQRRGVDRAAVDRGLNRDSGLKAVAGVSDMRELLRMREGGSLSAKLALEMYIYRILKTVGSYVAVLGGLDALVFTAGVGEHARAIRKEVCAGLACFGVSLDNSGPVQVLVIPTREEWAIADATHRILKDSTT